MEQIWRRSGRDLTNREKPSMSLSASTLLLFLRRARVLCAWVLEDTAELRRHS